MSADASPPSGARDDRLRALRALAAAGATPEELAIHLAASGYDTERAAALLEQLASAEPAPSDPDPATPAPADDPGGPALRVWASFERARFSPEAWGRLLRLRADGMDDAAFEHLVDRALLQLEGPVGVAELRGVVGDAIDTAAAPPTVH